MAISTLRTKRSRPMRLIGRPAEHGAEAGVVQGGEFGQARRGQVGAGAQFVVRRGAGEAVPRADGKAVVAAVDTIAHQRAQLVRDRARDARS